MITRPAFTVTFAVEDRPRVRLEVENEAEARRLEDWIFAPGHEAYAELLARAVELAEREHDA